MSFGGSTPKPPPPPPPAPTIDDKEVQQAGVDERKRRLAARGRAANILTSGQGVQGPAPSAAQQLLGL